MAGAGWTVFFGVGVAGLVLGLFGAGRWLALYQLGQLWRWQIQPEPGVEGPLVSVCIPARNEALVIERVVRSVLAQEGVRLECIVVDDRSEDKTAELLRSIVDPRLRVISGSEPPAGWLGKQHALSLAAAEAQGEVLLFVDADTDHHPRAVATALKALGDADVLVLLSGQELGSWSECLIGPFFWSWVLPALNVAKAENPGRPNEAMGNGQFAMVRATAYSRIGGHGAVRDVVVEDVALVRKLKAAGAKYTLRLGTGVTRTRMYRSFSEVWQGFSKNVVVIRPEHRVLDTALTLGFIGLVSVAELGPWVALGLGYTGIAVLHGLGLVWMRSAILRRLGCAPEAGWPPKPLRHPWMWALLQPVGAVLGIAVMLNALRLALTGGARWRGRSLAASRPL